MRIGKSPNFAVLTPEARRHVAQMGQAIAPAAPSILRTFAQELARMGYGAPEVRALVAITPAAGGGLRAIGRFLEQIEYNSGRLAKLNVPLSDVLAALDRFHELLAPVLAGRYGPAREQLQLVTSLILNQAFYRVREAEAQALFGIYRAEAEATDFDDFLQRINRVLTPSLRARAGRIVTATVAVQPKLTRPFYTERGRRDAELIMDGAMRRKFVSFWSYPLGPTPDGTATALAQFGFAVPYPWLPRELALLDAAAERVRAAAERVRLQTKNRHLELHAQRAEEEERQRIGRELHDETGQSLLTLRLQLEMMQREAPEGLRERLGEARGIAENAVVEIRRIVAALSPAILERLGLEAAVRHLVGRFEWRNAAKVTLRIDLGKRAMSGRVRDTVYRVAQEALENISRHSAAKSIKVLLNSTDQVIRLKVSDDGRGFDPQKGVKPSSFGLSGMKQRAALLGGTLTVKSAPGKGVRIQLEIPTEK